ncbi:MAG: ComEC/Rec2 family competence protein [Patescibacteria group bacterium]
MRKGVFIFWSIFIAGAITRVLFSLYQDAPDIGNCLKQTVNGTGIVAAEPERKESGQVFVILVNNLSIASTSKLSDQKSCAKDILIRVKTKLYPRFVYDDNISFTGKISKPFNFSNAGGRSFDYKGYLAKDEVFYEIKSAVVEKLENTDNRSVALVGVMDSFDLSEAKRRRNSSRQESVASPFARFGEIIGSITGKISSILFSIKRHFVANLEQTLGEPHSALAAGLVVGEKSTLGKDLLNDFRIVGLIHIVVLSGFNITIVGDAMRRTLSFLPRVWGIGIGGIGIALFGVMVGGGATVVRSCFMAGIALSADLIRRDYNVTRALIFAGLIMLIQNPLILLHDPSFQLSFLATLGLILLASPIEKKLTLIPEKFGIRGIVASTIATQIFVSPFILYAMGQISIIGMVANILVLPLIPATMLFVFLTGSIGFISHPFSQLFGWISHLLLTYELKMVEWFAQIPFASANLPAFSGWWAIGFYGVIMGVLIIKNFQQKIKEKQ